MRELRKSSLTFKVLQAIVDLGGHATRTQIAEAVGSTNLSAAYSVLESRFYIVVENHIGDLRSTTKGERVVRDREDALIDPYRDESAVPAPIVQSRTAKPFKPLDVSRYVMPVSQREGAYDQLQIPSLMGDTRKLPSGEIV